MKKTLILLGCFVLLGVAVARDNDDARKVLEFNTMVGVQGPYVGAKNPVRNIGGGGAAWSLTSGRGELSSSGKLEIHVRGLIVTALGRNPAATFRGVVSCQSIGAENSATIINVSTGDFAATAAGDSDIEARVSLPQPCIAPIVFVTLSAGRWVAVTGTQTAATVDDDDR